MAVFSHRRLSLHSIAMRRVVCSAELALLLLLWASRGSAAIYNNYDGSVIPGTEGITLGPGVRLSSFDLSFADLSGVDLTSAAFDSAILKLSWFGGSTIAGADFSNTTAGGFSQFQLTSSDSYQNRSLPGIRLAHNDVSGWNFRLQDLTNADFSESVLRGADLQQAVLKNVNFQHADLTNALLAAEDVRGAVFAGAIVRGAALPGDAAGFTWSQLASTASYQMRDLRGIRLGADLAGWNLSDQDLTGATLYYAAGANLTNATIAGATLNRISKAQLISTASYQARDLNHLRLLAVDLTGVSFQGHNLQYVDWNFGAVLDLADFSGADLTGAKLKGNSALGANFAGARLDGASLEHAILAGANFAGAQIRGLNLSQVVDKGFVKEQFYSTASYQAQDLAGVSLAGNSLVGWDFGGQKLSNASLVGALIDGDNFAGAQLVQAVLVGASATHANFAGANLAGAQLDQGDFTEANFTNANLARANGGEESIFTGANFTGADLTGATLGSADLALFRAANLTDAYLGNCFHSDFTDAIVAGAWLDTSGLTKEQIYATASYRSRNLAGIHLDYARLSAIDLNGQNLAGALLFMADLSNANLVNANLTGANLDSVQFTGANLAGALIARASLAGATYTLTREQLYSTGSYQNHDLTGIDWRDCNLSGWNFRGQNLAGGQIFRGNVEHVDFTGANLTQFAFMATSLRNANFTGADLSQASLSGDVTNALFDDAIVAGAHLVGATSAGFKSRQLYATRSYQLFELPGIDLAGCVLAGWDFHGQNLAGADFSNARLARADFTGASIQGAKLANVTVYGFTRDQLQSTASYARQNLARVSLAQDNLPAMNFAGFDLTSADVSKANLRFSNFASANLANLTALQTDFREANFAAANLRGAYLFADFRKATLVRADLTGASVSGSNFDLADLRGALMAPGQVYDSRAILADGTLNLLRLGFGEQQRVTPGVTIPVRTASPISISSTSALDLADNVLIVDYAGHVSAARQLHQYLSLGLNAAGPGAIWDGDGIQSSTARDDAQGLTALGMIDNATIGYDTIVGNRFGFGLAGGAPVPPDAVLVKYTYVGDTDLNGRVDGDDLVSFNVGYANHGSTWDAGDFDYSGTVDGDDLTSLLFGYARQGAPLGERFRVAAVPEPGGWLLLICAAAGLGALRRTS